MLQVEHVTIEFGLDQRKEMVVVDCVRNRAGVNTVAKTFAKVLCFAPKENQKTVISELDNFKKLNFSDSYLVSNK